MLLLLVLKPEQRIIVTEGKIMSYTKLTRDQIAERVAQDIPDGAYVNLGIGLPTKISSYLPSDKDVFLHSENGLLAFGPPPAGEEDP